MSLTEATEGQVSATPPMVQVPPYIPQPYTPPQIATPASAPLASAPLAPYAPPPGAAVAVSPMTTLAIDPNTVEAPLRINSSARLTIILAALVFFAVIMVALLWKGSPQNGLHQTVITGALWIIASIVTLMEAPTAADQLRALIVKQ